jgi:hypothetical protein
MGNGMVATDYETCRVDKKRTNVNHETPRADAKQIKIPTTGRRNERPETGVQGQQLLVAQCLSHWIQRRRSQAHRQFQQQHCQPAPQEQPQHIPPPRSQSRAHSDLPRLAHHFIRQQSVQSDARHS